MQFEKISKPDLQTYRLFKSNKNREFFTFLNKSAIKQLSRIINTSVFFYKVYDNQKFIGCLFVNSIDEKNKIIEFGGFADRHTNTVQAVKELSAFLKYHFPNYKIKALTKYLTAKLCLIKAGFKNNKGDYEL
ncbi:MAG: hypothetical protein LUH11_03735 [Candidatus Gastranaerophilales bacterium]|nr:hypothetical protein [Candidatus Gastranaerophilales bacterium]